MYVANFRATTKKSLKKITNMTNKLIKERKCEHINSAIKTTKGRKEWKLKIETKNKSNKRKH